MNIRKIYLLVFLSVFLVGCAGSPVHTSSMNSTAIRSVDDYTLCVAYTPREAYSPSATVRNEVRRRGLNCSALYTYTGTAALDNTAAILRGVQGQLGGAGASSTRPVAFYKSEYISGFNKICTYSRTGSDEAYTFKNTDICPRTMR